MRNPTEATAMIAPTVATVPSSVPCSQRTADTRTPDPAGSDSVSCACATLACIIVATAAISGEILVLIKRNTLYTPPWSLGGGRGLLVYGTSGAPTPESRVCTSTGGVSGRVGRHYAYLDVPEREVEAMRRATSKGGFFNRRIRDRYLFKRR